MLALSSLFGYGLAPFTKPLIGRSAAWLGMLAGRFLDRLGTGVRSAPRDALIAALASYPAGALTDRFGRCNVLLAGGAMKRAVVCAASIFRRQAMP